jgi:hypothetical protein
MMEFIRGIWTPLRMTSIPASLRMVSRLGNLPSRSRIRNRARLLASSRSMTRFFAGRATQDAVGCAQDVDAPGGVLDEREYVTGSGQGDGFEEVAGEEGVGLGSEEVGPGTGRALRRWVNPGLFEDLPDGGGGDLDPEDEEFAVEAAVAPARILLGEAEH